MIDATSQLLNELRFYIIDYTLPGLTPTTDFWLLQVKEKERLPIRQYWYNLKEQSWELYNAQMLMVEYVLHFDDLPEEYKLRVYEWLVN